ncbi:MAG: xanthine dehydrogenase family protein molybdopterin-binding subunit [Deltaproteobacteria bacterium]|nr:xanthine dehydrogenase family protein molybdopterin-binding subunit [Deltaproteobacteria bacterium]
MKRQLSRRTFVKGLLAGSGLTLFLAYRPGGFRVLGAEEIKKADPQDWILNAWISITPDDVVTITVSQSEMGQGVYTSIPQIVADELDADWKSVRFRPAPAADAYKNPVWGMQATGGSTSIRHFHDLLRRAGAAAREVLVQAAAQAWGVPRTELMAADGAVHHSISGRSLSYGKLAEAAAKLPLPKEPPLKDNSQFRFIGRVPARLDIPEKISGQARFGIDTFAPGLRYAAVARPPVFGARVKGFDEGAAKKVPGVEQVVRIDRGVAVCARSFEAARQGRSALAMQWAGGSQPNLDNALVQKSLLDHLAKTGVVARNDGDAQQTLAVATKKLASVYQLPYLAHVPLEPMNCTAWVQPERCDVWVPTQSQTAAQQTAAKYSGLAPQKVHIHTTYLGGGFGRRAETDVVEEAVQLSKAASQPVKVIWTREEDIRHDFFRPGNCCRIEGGLDGRGKITAWSHRVVVPSIFARVFPQMMEKGIDPAAVEGLANLPYAVPNLRVEYVRLDLPIPVGFWRSVGSTHNAFTVECFMDELARAAGKDPLEFRLAHMAKTSALRQVLERAAERAGWGKPLPAGQGRGLACHSCFGSHVAQVAEIEVNQENGGLRVHRVVCAVDCGPIINPDTVRAQMEGGIVMGLSAALKERVNFSRGGVATGNFGDYPLLRFSESPAIEVHTVQGQKQHGGVGEPGLPPIAPAVANALFAATGARIRTLPLTPAVVLEALKKRGKE